MIADALKTNKTLKSLDISQNTVKAIGAEKFFETLKVNRTITDINFGDIRKESIKRRLKILLYRNREIQEASEKDFYEWITHYIDYKILSEIGEKNTNKRRSLIDPETKSSDIKYDNIEIVSNLKKIEAELKTIQSKFDTQTEHNKKTQEKCDILEKKLTTLHEQNKKLQEESIKLYEENIKLNEDIKKLKEDSTKLHEEKRKLYEENARLREENRKIHEDNRRIQESNKAFQEEIKEINEEKTKLQNENAKLELDNRTLHVNFRTINEEFKKIQEDLTRLRDENNRLRDENKILKISESLSLEELEKSQERIEMLLKDVFILRQKKLLEQKTKNIINQNTQKCEEDCQEDEDDLCIVCVSNPKTYAYPCGHFCVCEICGLILNECPLCRREGKPIKIYM